MVSTRSRGGMSSGRGRPEIGRGRELTKAGQQEGHLPSEFRGEDAVADFTDSVSNLSEPIQGEVALQVTPKMTIAVAFHG